MKNTKFLTFAVALIMLMTFAACTDKPTPIDTTATSSQPSGQIYLYGEQHGVVKILDQELVLWCEYYDNNNMRHLFVELPYYTAEFLNIWMKSDNDDILEAVYEDWIGTMSYNPDIKEFYMKIKSDCPETIFHGTDVGHQYNTTGERYLKYLEDNNLEDSEHYSLVEEAIEQGKYFDKNSDHVYRENKMAENFIREFNKLNGEDVMGIYGGAHTGLDAMDYTTRSVPCMANQLKEVYKDIVYSEDLTWLATDIEPTRVDTIVINEKEYEASYFGQQDMTGVKDYSYREFWRLEDAYNDFKDNPKSGPVLPYDNYPLLVEIGQIFVIDYTKSDGSLERKYYRSDGRVWDGRSSTEEFTLE